MVACFPSRLKNGRVFQVGSNLGVRLPSTVNSSHGKSDEYIALYGHPRLPTMADS